MDGNSDGCEQRTTLSPWHMLFQWVKYAAETKPPIFMINSIAVMLPEFPAHVQLIMEDITAQRESI